MPKLYKNILRLVSFLMILSLPLFASGVNVYAAILSLNLQQNISTNGAVMYKNFEISNTSYLAVSNSTTFSTTVYRWNGSSYASFQSLSNGTGISPSGLAFTTIGSTPYLIAVGAQTAVPTPTLASNSRLFRWNGTAFVTQQNIPTNGGADAQFFTVGSDTYLAIAESQSNSSYEINSRIYRWNTGTSQFDFFQNIPTKRGSNIEPFVIGSTQYLMFSNQRNNLTNHNIDSEIYRWNGTTFVSHQLIATNGATEANHFIIGSDNYLAVANYWSGSSHTIDSKIYKWNIGTSQFDFYQNIATKGASGVESFSLFGKTFLAFANKQTASNARNINSEIFVWNTTTSLFESDTLIPTFGANKITYFQRSGTPYLAIANFQDSSNNYNLSSPLYTMDIPCGISTGSSSKTCLDINVLPGSLTIDSQASLNLSSLQVSATPVTVSATSSNITIEDLTGSQAGWSTTATMENFVGLTDNSFIIPLCSTTNCTQSNFDIQFGSLTPTGEQTGNTTNLTDYTNVQSTTSLTSLTAGGASSPFSVSSFPSGGGQGSFKKNFNVNVTIPPYLRAQSYRGVLTFSVS